MRVLLLGGGHAHALLLHRLATHPLPPPAAVTVVSPTPTTPYSGALPGWIEGVLTASDATIDIRALATAAGATFVGGEATAINSLSSSATLASSACLPYDVLSINVGGGAVAPPPGAESVGAVSVRPLAGAAERLAPLLSRVDAAAAAAAATPTTLPLPILVVGGGAAGCEVAAALASRGRRGVRVTLAAGSTLLPGAPPAGRTLVARELEAVGVAVDASGPVVQFVGEGGDSVRAVTSSGATLAATRAAIVLALPAAAPAWLASTGLALDAAGSLATGPGCACSLASGDRLPAPIFAVGDCATATTAPTPKAGVHAVRAVPVLEAAVRACVAGEGLPPPPPPPRPAAALALLSLGRGRAVALRPGWPPVAGRWVLAWKRWLDGRHVRKLGGGGGQVDNRQRRF